MGVADLLSPLRDNPYFSAGFGLAGVGAGMFALRHLGSGVGMLIRRHCLTTLELQSKDRSYEWMLQWLGSRANSSHHIGVSSFISKSSDGKLLPSFDTFPSTGQHYIWYKGKYIRIERNREKKALDIFETITLQTFGKKQFFVDMLSEAAQYSLCKQEGKTVIYFPYGSEWRPFGNPRRKRTISSVVLDEGKYNNFSLQLVEDLLYAMNDNVRPNVQKQRKPFENIGLIDLLLQDINQFMSSESWYADRGIPYRRGYLLHGPPGTGKTSFISAVAGALDYGISLINLGDQMLTDDRLYHLMAVAPQNSIILLEDIDMACVGRDVEGQNPSLYRGMGKLSLSGVLNALDGVTSAEARVVFMTTNYYDKLHPALLRPGRVDVKALIDYATPYQVVQMFRRFHPKSSRAECEMFAEHIKSTGGKLSPAQIQAYLMRFRDDTAAALANAKDAQTLCS